MAPVGTQPFLLGPVRHTPGGRAVVDHQQRSPVQAGQGVVDPVGGSGLDSYPGSVHRIDLHGWFEPLG